MTPNCGIRRTVCAPVGTPKSVVLGFILTRKHASKYKNTSCTSSLVRLKYKNSENTPVFTKKADNLQPQPAWSMCYTASEFYFSLLGVGLRTCIFIVLASVSCKVILSFTLLYWHILSATIVCIWDLTSGSAPLIHRHHSEFDSVPPDEY
jgi:hypothetical protein